VTGGSRPRKVCPPCRLFWRCGVYSRFRRLKGVSRTACYILVLSQCNGLFANAHPLPCLIVILFRRRPVIFGDCLPPSFSLPPFFSPICPPRSLPEPARRRSSREDQFLISFSHAMNSIIPFEPPCVKNLANTVRFLRPGAFQASLKTLARFLPAGQRTDVSVPPPPILGRLDYWLEREGRLPRFGRAGRAPHG